MPKGNLFYGQIYVSTIKRALDIFSGIVLGLFFLPICLLVALIIKLDSSGPVFADTPSRVGKNGRRFKMFKFRSMIKNAHQLLRTDPKFKALYQEYKKSSYKLYNDPRVTRFGKFIRKYSLDEVPQFLNVLWGDMSLVGPRAYYPDEIRDQLKKHPTAKKYLDMAIQVKPGITGFWQVFGRSEVHFDKRIKMDAEYVKKISLWYDISIIIKTPYAMLSGKGAI
jgi:lipopolysaccharide/colanic/teichoic acid biosynthesis glycosyltransferase